MKDIKVTWDLDDNCHDCGQKIVWGKTMSTGNGSALRNLKSIMLKLLVIHTKVVTHTNLKRMGTFSLQFVVLV